MITEKDSERLNQLIQGNCIDLETLKREGLDKYANINYLYIADRITISELARYWNLNRSTVYRKFRKDIKEQIKVNKVIKQYRSTSAAELVPDKVFASLSEYTDFLESRFEKENHDTIPVKVAIKILGLSKQQIVEEIKKKKILAIKTQKNGYKILKTSFELYVSETLKRIEMQINIMNSRKKSIINYINSQSEEMSSSMQQSCQPLEEVDASVQQPGQPLDETDALTLLPDQVVQNVVFNR